MDASLLPARVRDAANLCDRTNTPRFLGFLTPVETATALSVLEKCGCRVACFGGYEAAERVLVAVLPLWCDQPEFPLTAITVRYRPCDRLTHRDFLGALMGLGLTRESVGDILCEPGRTVAFLRKEVASFVLSQLEKVGSFGVTVAEDFQLPLPQCTEKKPGSDTVASLRLDGVIAALCACSRKTATEWITDGRVSVSSVACIKPTKTVATGDRISVRGVGKFVIENTDSVSKKGRIILQYSKYV